MLENILSLGFLLGFLLGALIILLYLFLKHRSLLRLESTSRIILEKAKQEATAERQSILEKAKDEARRSRSEADIEVNQKKIEIQRIEHNILRRNEVSKEQEERAFQKNKELDLKHRQLEDRESSLLLKEEQVDNSFHSLMEQLERISHMTKQEAKESLLNGLKHEVELENAQWIKKVEEDTRLKAKQVSIDIISSAMQRYAADQVATCSSGVVSLPSEDMKGRIIGKEGRNIRSLEMATGMEFIIGESSDTITISGFNPVRKEIAKRTLEALLQDGRINPTRIEEVAAKCEAEVDTMIEEMGQEVIVEMCLSGVHPEITKMLGKLYFRTSFSQNVLEHSKETAYFARMIAEQLGLDGKLAARCGLLHDIGKAMSHEIEGPHAIIGADVAKKYGENNVVVNAIAAHHEDVPVESVYGVITMIADTISASRVGARKETLTAYIKRLEQLEEIANSFDSVKKAYALQAGREIRIIVDENKMNDGQASGLARKIAKKVESEMSFPGQIKINVIREKRSIEYAK